MTNTPCRTCGCLIRPWGNKWAHLRRPRYQHTAIPPTAYAVDPYGLAGNA